MDLSSIDIKKLVFELKKLENAKIQKVYQTNFYELIFDFYSKFLPRFFYLKLPSTIVFKDEKIVMPNVPLSLARRLRSHLNNVRIRNVEQVNNDRIIKFFLEGKSQNYSLIFELFSKGNIILLNKYDKIIIIFRQEVFKDRILKPGKVYIPPKNKSFVFNKKNLEELFLENKDKHIITLLSNIGLGGKYSEKIVKKLYDKNFKSVSFKDFENFNVEFEKIFFLVKEYFESKKYFLEDNNVFLYNKFLDENKALFENIVFALKQIPLIEKTEEKREEEIKKEKKSDKKVLIQKKRVEELKNKSVEYEEKGKKIFENYVLLKKVLSFVKEFKQKNKTLKNIKDSWPETFPKLKSVDEKTGKIILEL